jgi:hypothetical protein
MTPSLAGVPATCQGRKAGQGETPRVVTSGNHRELTMVLTPWVLPADEDPQLVTARARIGFALVLLGARRRRRGDVHAPLTPMEVSALAELALRVCALPGQPQGLYALALAFDATHVRDRRRGNIGVHGGHRQWPRRNTVC